MSEQEVENLDKDIEQYINDVEGDESLKQSKMKHVIFVEAGLHDL